MAAADAAYLALIEALKMLDLVVNLLFFLVLFGLCHAIDSAWSDKCEHRRRRLRLEKWWREQRRRSKHHPPTKETKPHVKSKLRRRE